MVATALYFGTANALQKDIRLAPIYGIADYGNM
jgi:hypothetical protein